MEVMMAQHPWRMATPPTSRAPAHRPLCSLTGRPLTSQAGCPRQLPQPLPLCAVVARVEVALKEVPELAAGRAAALEVADDKGPAEAEQHADQVHHEAVAAA